MTWKRALIICAGIVAAAIVTVAALPYLAILCLSTCR
jgi:hypothetical protein